MNILILTGRFGMGHVSAAVSLAQQIRIVDSAAAIFVEDIFEYAMPEYSDKVYQAFELMVQRYSGFYNDYYNRMEKKGPDLKPAFLPYFLKKINHLVEKINPDIILSTLPLCSQIVSRYKQKTKSSIPLITCITDISSHSEWINAYTDCYMVPSKSVGLKLMTKRVPKANIYVYGIPVRAEFEMEKHPAASRNTHILIMGGGLGIMPESTEFYDQISKLNEVEITVITGKNQVVYKKIYGLYENIQVIGYTDEVYRYMQAADVIISKPGGITLFEAIRSETPILVFEPFLQQEINNTEFVVSYGIGMILKGSFLTCIKKIEQIICDDILMNDMKDNVKRLKQEYDMEAMEKILCYVEHTNKEVFV